MKSPTQESGSFTLPGEAGYEDLTIKLARVWGADTIRDSDGTVLSDRITSLGYDIYSTLCLVRSDNAWAKAHPDRLQQNYLMSFPAIAESGTAHIDLLAGFFRQQFILNIADDPREWWQVFDRTTGEEVSPDQWRFDPASGLVTVTEARPWHRYTVNFLAVRIWEEISMYNHITNDWGDREHLMAVDPIYPETRAFMLAYLEKWLAERPRTKVVRFTSLFYNFTWFWGEHPRLRYLYSDWGDYQMMASPTALRAFREAKGYALCSEDFINKGFYNCTHNAPSPRYRDWMDFINSFVVSFGRSCVDLVHAHGKKAYVFYDDHWIGVEPYGKRFPDFGFDGVIKCAFNGFEARKCAGVRGVATRELRLHPYLFPTGLKGEPTFKQGGNPARDARLFWTNIRRGLMREPVDRIGLGGYLHLVQGYPEFVRSIAEIAGEFRAIKELHAGGAPHAAGFEVAVLTAWGTLRSWICSGHMTPGLDLNELLESLAGLPVRVRFTSFDDIASGGIPDGIGVIVNAGRVGSAWSGGDGWADPVVIQRITAWVAGGGGFIGVAEPSALSGGDRYFRLSHILGVDRETGLSINVGKYAYERAAQPHFITRDLPGEPELGHDVDGVFAMDGSTAVLADRDRSVRIAVHPFGKGRGVYFSGHAYSPMNARLLHRAIFWAAGKEGEFLPWTTSDPSMDCAYFPDSRKLAVVNSLDRAHETEVFAREGKSLHVSVEPRGLRVLDVKI